MSYAEEVKIVLEEKIHTLSCNKNIYCRNPEIDFSRNKKLGFEEMIKILISMEGGTLNTELLKYFDYSATTATASAFVQQRSKIKENVFIDLFNEFNNEFVYENTFNGYRLIACDGTDLNIFHNPNDADTYYQTKPNSQGYNMLHLDACYDLCNRRYTDVIINPGQIFNECGAMVTMMDRYTGPRKTIFIADRGYESYNVFAHAIENGLKFLIRVKDRNSSGMLKGYQLPDNEEFDITISRTFTKGWTNYHKAHPDKYKLLPTYSTFDYLHSTKDYYDMEMRILRFAISEDSYECIITNLSSDEFDMAIIKKLYQLRWGIETAFRELKYAIGMTAFHSKKVDFIRQEIYARLIMYNFCELITTQVILDKKTEKYTYQLNYTMAIVICRQFFKMGNNAPPLEIEKLLQRYILPIRPGRKDRRKVIKNQPAVSFIYRVAA